MLRKRVQTPMIGYYSSRPIKTKPKSNGQEVTIQVDTGAAVLYHLSKNLPGCLFPKIVLRTYTGEPIPVLEEVIVNVLQVVCSDGPHLPGWRGSDLTGRQVHSLPTVARRS
jgi:hypothetical protein